MAALQKDKTVGSDMHQQHGRLFVVRARFCGENYVEQANQYMTANPGTGLLADIDGEAIIASISDIGISINAA